MTIVQCQKCFAGNLPTVTACHSCGNRLEGGVKGTALGGQVTVADADFHDGHIVDTAMAAQRSREAKVARRMLAFAAILYTLRVALVPVLMVFVKPDMFAPFAGSHVTPVHYVCMVMFGLCYFWARRQPLNATLTAGVLFLVAVVPGFLENPTIMGGALVGKLLMVFIMIRAVSAAIMYHVNCSRPEVKADDPKPKSKTSADISRRLAA